MGWESSPEFTEAAETTKFAVRWIFIAAVRFENSLQSLQVVPAEGARPIWIGRGDAFGEDLRFRVVVYKSIARIISDELDMLHSRSARAHHL